LVLIQGGLGWVFLVYTLIKGFINGSYLDALIAIQSHVEKDGVCGERNMRS